MASGVIDLDDDDDDAPAPGSSTQHNSCGTGSRSAPLLLEEGPPSKRSKGAGTSVAPVVLDLSDEEGGQQLAAPSTSRVEPAATSKYCLCQRRPVEDAYVLDECSHRFHKECLKKFVQQQLAEKLAHEIGCPRCQKQLSIRNVQDLSVRREAPAPVAHSSMPPWAQQAASMMQLGVFRNGHPAASAASASGTARGGGQGWRAAGSAAATKRILKELQAIHRSDEHEQGFSVEVPDESIVYVWEVAFFGFEKNSALARDLARVPGRQVILRVTFPSSFPSVPPYIRVIRPRFVYRTGHVTIGGSICTEMLTNQGWSASMTMESVLLGIRTNMVEGGARIDPRIQVDYSEEEARQAFDRMVRDHGWF